LHVKEQEVAEEPTGKRRLVKKVETVREKADKAEESSRQPRRLQTTKRRAAAPFRAAGSAGRTLGKFKPFRILGFILVPPYFRNSWKELRQVTWPTFPVALRLTFAVIIFALVFGCLVAGLDYGLEKIFKQVLLK
jgi:preprotein translocase SecE subunit